MGRTGAGEPGAAKGDVASWCWGSKMMEKMVGSLQLGNMVGKW